MLLTIGMIVKNEEKYLDRCLAAIKPILENVDSELIIADTGSSDKTVEIAKKYTDKVFSFKWIDDFAAARNSTLERASGEWYMFLDADEIFESCDAVISFFNTGEYRNYDSASVVIRSLYDSGDSSDFNAPRLTKILPDTAFTGIIHESLNTYGKPVKHLSDIALHYGYLHTQDTKEEKFKRNSELLLKKYALQDDSDPIIYLQLYECFYLNDRKKAEEFLEKGIDVCVMRESPVLIALYCHKAHISYFDGDYEKTLAVCRDYFKMGKNIRPGLQTTDCEMHGYRASSLFHTGHYEEAVSAYTSFFSLYGSVSEGRLKTDDADLLVYYLASENNLSVAVYEFLKACQMTQDHSSAAETLLNVTLDSKKYPAEHIKAISDILNSMIMICDDEYEKKMLVKKVKEF